MYCNYCNEEHKESDFIIEDEKLICKQSHDKEWFVNCYIEFDSENAELKKENDRRRNLLEDVINELDLSKIAIEKHGQLGTEPAELVKLVLEEKDSQISMLKIGMVDIKQLADLQKYKVGFEKLAKRYCKDIEDCLLCPYMPQIEDTPHGELKHCFELLKQYFLKGE